NIYDNFSIGFIPNKKNKKIKEKKIVYTPEN
ncbi:unnamed protein product, partial [marine sediment metagenome]